MSESEHRVDGVNDKIVFTLLQWSWRKPYWSFRQSFMSRMGYRL